LRRGTGLTRTLLLSLTDWSDIAISSDGGGGRVRTPASTGPRRGNSTQPRLMSLDSLPLDAPFWQRNDRC